MAGTREYNFNPGWSTAATPDPTDPTVSTDLVTKGYADKSYARGLQSVALLKAIAAADRADNLPIFVDDLQGWFHFDSSSTATGNDLTVIVPTAGTGRWIRFPNLTTFTIANNQVAAANVTGLVFDKTKVRSFMVEYQIYRSASGGQTRAQRGTLIGITDGTNWDIIERPFVSLPSTSDVGVTFTITSAGQIQYTSDDNGGTYSAANSKMDWKTTDLMGL
jgi:hypothetical protein